MKLAMISVADIEKGHRTRVVLTREVQELAASIKEMGVIVPFGVMTMKGNEDKIEWKSDKKYLLLHGGRRYAASCQVDENLIVPALIFDRKVDNTEAWNIELVENLHRKNLPWPEEIALKLKIHQGYIKQFGEKTSTSPNAPGWSKVKTSKALGISPQQLGSDLFLAEAIASQPSLTTLNSKGDAHKVLSAAVETVERRHVVEKIENKKAKTPMGKYKKALASRYMINDFFIGVNDIPDNSIDLVEIDPPYGMDLNKMKKSESDAGTIMQGYYEIDENIYPAFLTNTMKESFRVLKEGGVIICWFAPEPWFEQVYKSMRRAGFKTRRIPALWMKGGGQTMAPNIYLANSYEMFFYGFKGSGELVKKGRSNIFQFAPVSPSKKIHPTERPIELMEEILNTFTEPDSKILVPYAGSGNTILAADNAKMTAFGFDLTKDYKNGFTLRIGEKSSPIERFRSYN